MLLVTIISVLAVIACAIMALDFRAKCSDNNVERAKHRKIIRQLNIMNELSAELLSSLETDFIIDILLDKSKELLKATRSALILVSNEGKIQNFYSSMGPTSECKTALTGLLRKVFIEMSPVRGNNPSVIAGFKGFPKHHPDIKNLIIVPVLLRGDIIGELIVTDKIDNREFTHEDEDILLTIAFYFAFALEKVRLHEEVKRLATTDGLTGLHNHRSFQERMLEETERSKRSGRPYSLLMLDIDRFKDFNDNYGHRVGDDLLKLISGVLSSNTRGIDMAARYGGEEFAILLAETSLEGAHATAERIRQQVKKTGIKINGDQKSVTISIGIATYPDDGNTSDDIIEAADKALYLSKRSGRNRVSTFSERN